MGPQYDCGRVGGAVSGSCDLLPYRSPHARSLYEAEQLAKEARKRVWEGFQEEAKGEQNGEGEEEEEKEEDVPATTEEEESERTTNYQNACTSCMHVGGLFDECLPPHHRCWWLAS